MSAQIEKLSTLEHELELVSSTTEAHDIYSQIKTIETMARKINYAIEFMNPIVAARLKAERKIGELIPIDFPHGGYRHGESSDHGDRLTLADINISRGLAMNCKRLATIPFDVFEDTIINSIEKNAALSRASFKNANHQYIHQSADFEWITPSIYIEAARTVMGSIDLDPASSINANKYVKSSKFYTIKNDGLSKVWHGNVWLNPPYGLTSENKSNQSVWSERITREYTTRNIKQGILLINAVPSESWFHPLWDNPICFVNRRIQFINPEDNTKTQPTHSSAIVYFGDDIRRFIIAFEHLGTIAVRAYADEY
jgi:hypothetical protein